jgi:hypothetical protein
VIVDVKVPLGAWLQAHHGAMLTIVCAMCADDAYVMQTVIFRIGSKHLADLFAAPFFALLAGTYVKNFGGCMFLLAHYSVR